jgi:hypothetical protein
VIIFGGFFLLLYVVFWLFVASAVIAFYVVVGVLMFYYMVGYFLCSLGYSAYLKLRKKPSKPLKAPTPSKLASKTPGPRDWSPRSR